VLDSEFGSIVPPDFEDTMRAVLSTLIALFDGGDRARLGRVEHVRRSPRASAYEPRKTSGERLEPPCLAARRRSGPSARTADERGKLVEVLVHLVAIVSQPSRSAISGVPAGAHNVTSLANAAHDVLLGRRAIPL